MAAGPIPVLHIRKSLEPELGTAGVSYHVQCLQNVGQVLLKLLPFQSQVNLQVEGLVPMPAGHLQIACHYAVCTARIVSNTLHATAKDSCSCRDSTVQGQALHTLHLGSEIGSFAAATKHAFVHKLTTDVAQSTTDRHRHNLANTTAAEYVHEIVMSMPSLLTAASPDQPRQICQNNASRTRDQETSNCAEEAPATEEDWCTQLDHQAAFTPPVQQALECVEVNTGCLLVGASTCEDQHLDNSACTQTGVQPRVCRNNPSMNQKNDKQPAVRTL
jgi:hypothetical protein